MITQKTPAPQSLSDRPAIFHAIGFLCFKATAMAVFLSQPLAIGLWGGGFCKRSLAAYRFSFTTGTILEVFVQLGIRDDVELSPL